MYEIWLAANIVWEIVLDVWPGVAAAALAWLLVLVAAARQPRRWAAALRPAALAGLAGLVLAFLAVPSLTRSSLGELAYWVDWANLLAIAAGAGAAVLAFAWPLLAMRGRGG
ncbi:hypothetical protein [Rubrivivax gelatinosus]|uniref:Transmembrane protein n=1 Tax=Rubrivivax gelatinosus TaxID=28068 RepID=A0A4V2SFZ3_RUBGE|nr:hypothetical protein [Rubrivivax gelatinosus]MBK1687984.1 hypothetical protein [Rubrivivax gelatinosus]TCO99267.1 hypothetical protein EV684_11560 [Rubrivivax gelatinosus]